MKRAVLLSLPLVAVVLYIVILNQGSTTVTLWPERSFTSITGVVLAGAFLAGVLLALLGVALQASGRALRAWRVGRRERRSLRLHEWEQAGEQLLWGGEIARGRALLQKVWQRRPEDPRPALLLAQSYCDTGEFHRARGVLVDASVVHHSDPEVLFALAEVHRLSGETAPRIEVLERLRALHPRSARALAALRDAYAAAGHWTDAASVQEAFMGLLPDPVQAQREGERLQSLRYQAALHMPDPQARLQALEALAASRNVPAPVYVALGDELAAAQRLADASAVWERGLRAKPQGVFVQRLLRIATSPSHRDRIRNLLRKVRSDSVQADAVRLWVAETHLADGNAEPAAAELQAVEAPAMFAADYDRLWAQVHRLRGQVEQALHSYQRACGEEPFFQCSQCERVSADWLGVCPRCGSWAKYRARIELSRELV